MDGRKKRGRGLLGTWWMFHAHVRQPKHCFWLCYSHGFYLFPVSSASQAQETIFSSWLCACGGLHGKAQIGKSLLTVAGRLKTGQVNVALSHDEVWKPPPAPQLTRPAKTFISFWNVWVCCGPVRCQDSL